VCFQPDGGSNSIADGIADGGSNSIAVAGSDVFSH
jgi:hypothetical protein